MLSREKVGRSLSHLLRVDVVCHGGQVIRPWLRFCTPRPLILLPVCLCLCCCLYPEPCNSLGGDSLLIPYKAQKADTAVIMSLSVWPGAQK